MRPGHAPGAGRAPLAGGGAALPRRLRLATPFVAGLGLYAFVVASFDPAELACGFGDQWVAGGAMAISALAAAAVAGAGVLAPVREAVALVLWATVFPVGMYAVMSFAVGGAAGSDGILAFARAWTWVAVAVWAVVFTATAMRAADLLRGARPVHEVGDSAV